MALFIRDEAVDTLAEELRSALKVSTKKEAVRLALERELRRARRERPLKERLDDVWKMVDAMGPRDPDFDMKKFMDELSGDI